MGGSGHADDQLTEDVKRLRSALRALPEESVRATLGRCGAQERRELAGAVGVQVDPRFVRGGFERLVATRLRGITADRAVDAWHRFAGGVVDRARELLGERADDPSEEEIAGILDPLLDEFGQPVVTVCFAGLVVSGATAARPLRRLLTSDERLVAQPTSTVDDAGEEADAGGVAAPKGGPGEDGPSEGRQNADASEVVDARSEEDAGLFTPLDELLIRSAVATCNEQVGALELEDHRRAIAELLRLNAERRSSYFHAGFIESLSGEPIVLPDAASNEERRRWYWFGRLCGLVRLDRREEIAGLIAAERRHLEAVLADQEMGRALLGPCVLALLEDRPRDAAALLAVRQQPFAGIPTLIPLVSSRARRLLAGDQPGPAEALFEALVPWARALDESLPVGERDHLVVTRRYLAACRRRFGDFVSAGRLLEGIELDEASQRAAALLDAERGLVAAEVEHLGHVRVPRRDEEHQASRARLAPGEPHLRRALELDPGSVQANYCLGVLAWCEGDHEAAATLLENAKASMGDDPVYERTGLRAEAAFHQGLARLHTELPGVDGPACRSMESALDAGFRPSSHRLAEAVEALLLLSSPHAPSFLARACEVTADLSVLVEAASHAAQEGEDRAVGTAIELGGDRRLGADERFALLVAAMEGMASSGTDRWELAVERVEDLLSDAVRDDLDARWARLLEESQPLRSHLGGVEAELQRIGLLVRLGRGDEAVGIAERLFRRAVEGSLEGFDAEAFVELLRDLHAPAEVLERCTRLLPDRGHEADSARDLLGERVVTLLFVGGNETQQRYEAAVDSALRDRYGGRVQVRWFHTGWSPNWGEQAVAVERAYPSADALILMAFVRTNLGRRLRRSSGEAQLPWVACTGHGRQSIERAIEEAVRVVVGSRASDGGHR